VATANADRLYRHRGAVCVICLLRGEQLPRRREQLVGELHVRPGGKLVSCRSRGPGGHLRRDILQRRLPPGRVRRGIRPRWRVPLRELHRSKRIRNPIRGRHRGTHGRIIRKIGIARASLLFPRAAADAGQLVSPADRNGRRKPSPRRKIAIGAGRKNTIAVLLRNGTGDPSLDPMRKGIPLLLVTDLSGVAGSVGHRADTAPGPDERRTWERNRTCRGGTAPRVGKLLVPGGLWEARSVGRSRPGSTLLRTCRRTHGTMSENVRRGEIELLFEVEKEPPSVC
jgi:hypothetical protein